MKSIYLIMLGILIASYSYSQNKLVDKDYYKAYDSLLRYDNNTIYNGLAYVDKYPSLTTKSHKFFGLYDFFDGDIIYEGQPYFDLKIKYDLLNDLVLVEYINEKVNYLSLKPISVREFLLNEHKFFRLQEHQVLKPFYGNGFFKVDYLGIEYSLFTKHLKNKVQKFKNSKVYYVFTNDEVQVLQYKNQFYKIDSKKDLINAIPEKEDYIQNFYKSNKRLYNKNRYEFILKLLKALENPSK